MGSSADTVVVVHGGPGLDSDYLAPDLEPLAEIYTLIAYDQRGAGKSTLISDSTVIDLSAHIDDLEAIRRHFGITELRLLGHSWGGNLIARYALAHPGNVAKLILSNPAPARRNPYLSQLGPKLRAWMDSTTLASLPALQAARVDSTGDLQESCRAYWRVLSRGYFADPFDTVTINGMRGDFCTSSGEALLNGRLVNRVTWRSLGDWDWRDDFVDLTVPTLIITGPGDTMPLEATEEWEEALPKAELVVLEGTGHYPHVERPGEYFGSVTEFLER